jgi:c-di-GMP-related signal transduction protein
MSVMTPTQPSSISDVFIGRQPIFDRDKNVFGYELLYRSGSKTNAYACDDGDRASRSVMHGGLNVVGLNDLVGHRRAFINITRKLLINEEYAMLPAQTAVIELLETVEPDDEVVNACKALKQAGYLLALDDFVFDEKYEKLLLLADILKIDFMASSPEKRQWFAKRYAGKSMQLLAEKVESYEDFQEALDLGYSYFQGYFFCKPEIVTRRDIPTLKANCLHFVQEVNKPVLNFDILEEVVKRDMSLSAKLLKYLNSSAMGLPHRITSIKQALTLLGEKPLRKWSTLVALAAMGQDKPPELLTTALVRARFCELLGPVIGLAGRELDLFLMGLFSVLAALMDHPVSELVSQISLPPDVLAALLGANNALGKAYAVALAFERGKAPRIETLSASMNVPVAKMSQLYCEALAWASQSAVP